MSKKVLVISASPRKGGNSDTLCDQFVKGAKEAGNNVEKISLREKKLTSVQDVMFAEKTGNAYKKMIWLKFWIK